MELIIWKNKIYNILGVILPFLVFSEFKKISSTIGLFFNNEPVFLIVGLFMVLFLLIPFYNINKKKPKKIKTNSLICYLIIASLISIIINLILNCIIQGNFNIIEIINNLNIWNPVINIYDCIIYILLIPIIEELLFRGILFNFIEKYLNNYSLIFIVSLIFGFYHNNIYHMLFGFIISLFLCYVYSKTDNIYLHIITYIY